MMIKSFAELEKSVQSLKPVKMVVVSAGDEKVLNGLKIALQKGVIFEPILVGDARQIEKMLREMGENVDNYNIEDTASD
nr:hypothetical protein [Atribacterota bacterium]